MPARLQSFRNKIYNYNGGIIVWKNSNQANKRSSFSSRIGFCNSCNRFGRWLGNIWRFPYLAAKYGGGIFIHLFNLVYTFGYTMIMSETALGRMTGKARSALLNILAAPEPHRFGGWINAIVPMLIVPYSVIGDGSSTFSRYFSRAQLYRHPIIISRNLSVICRLKFIFNLYIDSVGYRNLVFRWKELSFLLISKIGCYARIV